MVHFWLRAEVKPLERRTALTPSNAAKLISATNATISVERSTLRIFKDEEYEAVGCTLVETGTWPNAPEDAVILGLKELPEETTPIKHKHIFFAHCFKNQRGWAQLLQRFAEGKGTLYDLEFLTDANGRRVAAFGRTAGFVGMAVGLQAWCKRQLIADSETDQPLGALEPSSSDELIAKTQALLDEVKSKTNKTPSVIVIGAKGRVGRGAVEVADLVKLSVAQWDIEETAKGGPFKELLDFDVIVNCIALLPGVKVPPFITEEMLRSKDRKTTVINDISCDFTNPDNPFPFYWEGTTFTKPILRVISDSPAVDVIAIDHLPSLIPAECSAEFSDAMLPHFLEFEKTDVWKRAFDLFQEKTALAIKETN